MELKKINMLIGLLMMFFTVSVGISAQDNTSRDSLRTLSSIRLAEDYLARNITDTALIHADKALSVSIGFGIRSLEGDSYFLLGKIYDSLNDWSLSLRYYLKAAALYSDLGLKTRESGVYSVIAVDFYNSEVYNKAAEYYMKKYNLVKSTEYEQAMESSLGCANSWFKDRVYDSAVVWYDSCMILAEAYSDSSYLIASGFGLTASYINNNEYDRAVESLESLNLLLEAQHDSEGLAEVYNSFGLIDFEKKDYPGALENYVQSANYLVESGESPLVQYTNIAIVYQNLEQNQEAQEYFELALNEARKTDNEREEARLNHILAVLSHSNGDLYHADYYSNAAIEAAGNSGELLVLQESYLTYSDVLEEGNDFVRALDYYEKYLALRDSLSFEQRVAEQESQRRRSELENIEQRLLLTLRDEELKDIMIENLRIENEKRMNELKLLESEKELKQSEMDRLEQAMALDRERYNTEIQRQAIRDLEQETAIQELELERQQQEELELLQKNQLQESELRTQQLELEKEQEKRRRAIVIVVLMVLIALIILASFISSRRKNTILSAQKKEIEKNKEEIEEKNLAITDSIEYASRIQKAVLAPENFLNEWEFENCIYFRPKDIVSGDFYWGQKKDEQYCFAAADCTGHGVPGAFMSMLGNAYLNDIFGTREFVNAADILDQLRFEVMKSLKQRGEEGEAQDGMDIALCLYNRETNILHYAGANNPLYHIRNNELNRIDADKMPIGIHRSSDKPFTNNIIKPEKDDRIYMFSDGYADQFGGPEEKKFKYSAFRELLMRIHKDPMEDQYNELDRVLLEWMGDVEQVDDILVMGLVF